MDFFENCKTRQSCRNYDENRAVEPEKLARILECARLAPSACNGQPYHFTVCTGNTAKRIAESVTGPGMNRFAAKAPVMIVISEESYVATAALGAKLKKNDYRSMDIGIASAYITSAATELGLGSCILGWFDSEKIQKICSVSGTVRLVITIGYPAEGDVLREKKRKDVQSLITYLD